MLDVDVVQAPKVRWNLFVSACIFVGGLLLKVGAPAQTVLVGAVLAGLWNWKGPTIMGPWGKRPSQ